MMILPWLFHLKPHPPLSSYLLIPPHQPNQPRMKHSAPILLESTQTAPTISSTIGTSHRHLLSSGSEIECRLQKKIRPTFAGIALYVCLQFTAFCLITVLQRRAASSKPEVQEVEASMIRRLTFHLFSQLPRLSYSFPPARSSAETQIPQTQIGSPFSCHRLLVLQILWFLAGLRSIEPTLSKLY